MRYALLSVLVCSVGCSNDDVSLTIARFGVFMSNCTVDPASTVGASAGVLDLKIATQMTLPHGYELAPVVHNNQITTATATMAETSNVYLTSFDVELQPGDTTQANALPQAARKYNVPVGQALISPGGGSVSVPFEAIPPAVVTMLAGANTSSGLSPQPLTLKVRAVGQRSGVTEAGGFGSFPVTLCYGCLEIDLMACLPTGFPAASVEQGTPCSPQQDAPVSCCTDPNSGKLRCGAEVPIKTGM
jgi:hypothetical protein